MGAIVSVKQRARKKSIAITTLAPHLFATKHQKSVGGSVSQRNSEEKNHVLGDEERELERELERKSEQNNSWIYKNGEVGSQRGSLESGDDLRSERLVRRNKDTDDVQTTKPKATQDEEGNGESSMQVIVPVCETINTNDEAQVVNEPRGDILPKQISDQGITGNQEDAFPCYSLSSTPDSLCQGRPRDVKPRSATASPVNRAVSSWGEGVVGTSAGSLRDKGHVTSRGLDASVKSSASCYNDFAHVHSYKSSTVHSFQVKTHDGECTCERCNHARSRERAAIKIQSQLRGYQARKESLKKRKTILKIQRIYRARVQKRQSAEHLGEPPVGNGFRRSRTPSPNLSQGVAIGVETKENFDLYQGDITELKWRSQQLIETANMGEDYEPQKILLIASNMQRPDWLARVSLKDVHVIMYQFSEVTLKDIIENISLSLDDYRVGSKARRIAFLCQGGPGYLYICRGKVLTSKKLAKTQELRDFLRQLGDFISKKDPSDAKVHFIGNNVLGNKRGVKLLQNIKECMHPARVSVESPFEMSESGIEMLNEYFNIDLYNIWKKNRFTKMNIPDL